MNVTELARQVRIPTQQLREILPELGFDIGMRAIKVDDKIARDIINKLNDSKIREKALNKDEQSPASTDVDQSEPASPAGGQKAQKEQDGKLLQIGETIVVKDLAQQMNMPVTKLILELMRNGVMAALNQSIDYETAAIIAEDLGFQVEKIDAESQEHKREKIDLEAEREKRQEYLADDAKNLQPRPPVITIMGHVDHGKTKLLDAIRQTNVVESEAGGITQHIGAYQVIVPTKGEQSSQPRRNVGAGIPSITSKDGQKNDAYERTLTFIDTPGHEAFSAMRSRGAQVADIVILVVAADDGIQPQTIEAIAHIKSANLPFIVAINKIDKPAANIDKIKSELAELKLAPEDWGGQTICVEISAKQKINIDGLLDTLLLVYEMEKDKIQANPQRQAVGTIIESHLDKGEGPVATVLIQTGTLKKSDIIKIGHVLGKIRIMKDWQGRQVEQALPSMPVKIIGLKSVPDVGEILQVISDTKSVKKELRKSKGYKPVVETRRGASLPDTKKESDEEKQEIQKLNIILKSDVTGSEEAILESLNSLQQPDLVLNVVHSGLGNITEVDVERAEKQKALLIGFNIKPATQTEQIARDKDIQIKTSKIIYELLDYIKGEMNKMLAAEIKTEIVGKIKILKIFRTEKDGQIIGGKVQAGKVETSHRNLSSGQMRASPIKLNIYRHDELIGQAELTELQSAKQVVSEVLTDQEAGMKISGFNQAQEGDIIEVVKETEISRQI